KLILFSITTVLLLVAGCGNSSDPIQNIQDEMHYIEKDGDREYVITFFEDGRADVAWYGMEDRPESITYEISEEPIEVENEEQMKSISFDNFPSREKYGLSNRNDNTYLIDDSEEQLVLRDFETTKEDAVYLKKDKEFETPGHPATEEDDIFLVTAEND